MKPSKRWLSIAATIGIVFAFGAVIWVRVADSRLPDPIGYPELDVGARVVQWGANDDRPLYLHLLGSDQVQQSALPAILFVHGARGNPGDFQTQAQAFADAGGIGVLVEYSTFAEGADTERQARDLFDVVSFVRNNADDLGIDPNRITVAAASAGARAASRSLTDNDDAGVRPNSFVWLNPALGLVRWPPDTPTVPTLVMHGDSDALVEMEDVLDLCVSMGDDCEYRVAAGGGHGFFNEDRYRDETTAEFVSWVLALGG
ncbi:MAG: hypothetical protein R2770_05935 [Acidimicrobiales bacterium]